MFGILFGGFLIFIIGGAFLAVIIYLIVKRIEDKKKEDFEKRDW